jgi:hypothetical protein
VDNWYEWAVARGFAPAEQRFYVVPLN